LSFRLQLYFSISDSVIPLASGRLQQNLSMYLGLHSDGVRHYRAALASDADVLAWQPMRQAVACHTGYILILETAVDRSILTVS
jgi:hypothetical protein